MDFSHSDKVRLLQEQLQRFMDAHVYPAEPLLRRGDGKEPPRRQPLAAHRDHGGAEAQGKGGESVESVPAALRARRRDSPISSTRRCARSWDARIWRPRPSIAPPPTRATWKCWPAMPPPEQQGTLAGAAARRADPLGLRDDRARRGLERCHQYPVLHRARRRSLRDQRPQVVDLRRRRSALRNPDLHGQDESGRGAAQPAVDDPRAHEHARREAAAPADACSATITRRTATRRSISSTCACRRRIFCSERGAASKSRRAAWDPAAFIIACA